jgi:hypothetical protein
MAGVTKETGFCLALVVCDIDCPHVNEGLNVAAIDRYIYR